MPPDEGLALYEAGLEAGLVGPLLEIGSYCGKSATYLGEAARERGTVLFSIDHHRGSEEMQAGWEHHDPEVADPATGVIDSLRFFRQTIAEAGLDETVIAVVGDSPRIAEHWATPLGLVFIDGAHSTEPARADYEGWEPKIVTRGFLAIHDVFADPSDGGQGPFEIFERAVGSGMFEVTRSVGSLRVLLRLDAG